jgi:predicted ATPase
MITSLSLKNFKSIKNQAALSLNNISVICGSNSSGKSSIIQAILMLSQTYSNRYLKSTVSLNGKLVRLGSFTDIMNYSCKEKEKHITIDIKLDFPPELTWDSIKSLNLSITFAGTNDTNKKYEGEFHPEIIKGSISFEKLGDEPISDHIEFSSFDSGKQNPDLFNVTSLGAATTARIGKEYPDFKIEGISKGDLIPHELNIVYDSTKKLSQTLVPFLIGSPNYLKTIKDEDLAALAEIEIPRALLNTIGSLIETENEELIKNYVISDEVLKIIKTEKDALDLEHVRTLLARQAMTLTPESILSNLPLADLNIKDWRAKVEELNDKERKALFDLLIRNREEIQGTWYINRKRVRAKTTYLLRGFTDIDLFMGYFLPRKIKYLGPLRYEPQAMYQAFDLSEPKMVGLKGENTPAVLHLNKNSKITYPVATEKPDGKINFSEKENILSTACTDWLSYMGVITEFQTFDKGKLGYELQVKTSSDDHMQDLTHVGVGVSQVLPIVVMALLSEPDDILIFEQPELHLHPKVQSRLTDFFIALSKNRQIIIETHSEYIINRLRLRIAQSRDNELKDRSAILFVNKASEGSDYQKVDITSFGSIVDWPEDFFDQTDTEIENILLEAVAKKKELSNAQNHSVESN